MEPAQTNLKRAAVEFLSAACAAGAADPLDRVSVDLPDLEAFEPVLSEADLAALKDRLARERLFPETVAELVSLARRVAAALGVW